MDRRELCKLLAYGSVVSAAGLACARTSAADPVTPAPALPPAVPEDFVFLQLSDTHLGYTGPDDPLAPHTLAAAVDAINASPLEPDFVVFTGDLTQKTDDATLRRARLGEFAHALERLKVKTRYFLPGEHDAAADGGAAFRERFGASYGSFEHKGVHCVRLDNVSLPGSLVGAEQLAWLERDLATLDARTPLVVFAHRPLFELYPAWDWATADGDRVLALLARHPNVTVFYGHIHQEHHHTTDRVVHHAARSLVFPLPAPGSVAKKAPLPWDPASRDHGLGYRRVHERAAQPELAELNLELAALPEVPT